MRKQKTTSNKSDRSKNSVIVTEEDRVSNPIFKTIANRVRNLNKKLLAIQELETRDRATLKPEQLQKLAGKGKVESDIAKNEEFALFYKSILVENGGVVFDTSEEIMKLATLLTVGWHRSTHEEGGSVRNLGSALEDYGQVVGRDWPDNTSISDCRTRVYSVLNSFLTKGIENDACKDYISDISELEEAGKAPARSAKGVVASEKDEKTERNTNKKENKKENEVT